MLVIYFFRRKKSSPGVVRKNLLALILSGAAIGFNWVLLFQSYRFTTVAVSTLVYYFAPVLIILFSTLFFHEKISAQKWIGIAIVMIGMVFISGLLNGSSDGRPSLIGILLAFGAAVLYAGIIITNKKLSKVDALERTMIQMLSAGIVMIPYTILAEEMPKGPIDTKSIVYLVILCLVHTGIAYILYFDSIAHLPASTCGILSYIDPAFAVICSMTILREGTSLFSILGAVLILGGAIFSELNLQKQPGT